MIFLYLGPMMSGKSSSLLVKLERAHYAKKEFVLIRPPKDTRKFLAHSKIEYAWLKDREVFSSLADFDACKYDVIGIDEGQFHRGLKDFCLKYSMLGKHIYISALHATSESEMFDEIVSIIPYCNGGIEKLNAVCTICGSDDANYTFYKAGNKVEKEKVGGSDDYTALCEKCYFNNMGKQ